VKRREFITLLGGAAAAWPLAVGAQQAPARPLIGVLSPITATDAKPLITAFRSALRDLGYVEGRNMTIAIRYAEGAPERMALLARELVALTPDVIVAGAYLAAARDATRTIPIVALTPEDPVEAGLAQSLSRPGGNVTGTWTLGNEAMVEKTLDFFKIAVPGLTRLGALFNPDDPTDRLQMSRLSGAARAVGVTTVAIHVRDIGNLDLTAAEIERANVNGLFIGQAPFYLVARTGITAMATRLKLPAVYGFRQYAEAGGLMAYGPSLIEIYRQSARLVDRVVKGTKPAELPFELPTRYELVINLKAAKAIGLEISDSFLLAADEVIE
jgi:putative tryptophan/tyrosine transport system substrate-binding protein